MTKTKIISIALLVTLLFSACLFLAGCPAPEEKNKEYDVAIKIVCKEVVDDRVIGPIHGEWTFSLDVDELHIERDYDGKQYGFYVYKYNMPQHPEWSDVWFSPNGGGANVFLVSLGKEGQIGAGPKYVSEKGNYSVCVNARGALWKYRSVRLYITVK